MSEDGSPSRLVGITFDVTEQRVLGRQLKVFDRVLRHNLQNKLSIFRGYAQTNAEEADGDVADRAHEIVCESDNLRETLEKQRELVELLIDPPEAIEQDIVTDLEEATASVANRFPEADVEFHATEAVTVDAVPEIRRGIRGLIENAIVHHDDDPEVTVTIEANEDTVAIDVADNGPGISEQDKGVLSGERIDPLYHGSGLGLWLVHWIVVQSGGMVEFEENEPRGTVVTVELPRAD